MQGQPSLPARRMLVTLPTGPSANKETLGSGAGLLADDQRQVQSEAAAPIREVSHAHRAAVRRSSLSNDHQAQPEASLVLRALHERLKQLRRQLFWHAAAFVLYLELCGPFR